MKKSINLLPVILRAKKSICLVVLILTMSIQVLQATTNRLFIKKEGKIISANKNEADITIKGTVTDKEKGDPLPGVSIKVRGAQGGSISDASGKFTIRADENALLINTWLNIFAALGESLH